MTYLSVKGLDKYFPGVQALDGIEFELHENELLVILGPTGAGKTTLLRCLSGLESSKAQITMEGKDISSASPAERDMALVFQNFSLYPNWTVRENLRFPLKAPSRNIDDAECDRLIQWAASILRIEPLLDRKASRLSGGEMQRVAIGRAIVRKPKIFLMDEPLTNLDAKLRESLRLELVNLRRSLKTPMIYVTHDQAEALSMADRILVLEQGRILQSGDPVEIYQRPASLAVAQQLGQPRINVFPVIANNGLWQCQGQSLLACNQDDGSTAQIGVRPEHLIINGGAELSATIKFIEHAGPDLIVAAECLGQDIHILCEKKHALTVGAVVPIGMRHDAVSVWHD